jgi:hypothetical protein
MRRFLVVLVLTALVGLAAVSPAAACPMCKEAVPASGDGSALTTDEEVAVQQARAWNNSIYLFVGMPYLLVGGVGFLVYRSFKKARPAQGGEPPAA